MTRTRRLSTPLCALLGVLAIVSVARAVPADSTGVSLPPPDVRRWQVGAVRPDRLQHASLSGALACGGALASEQPVPAATATIALGVLKELHDARRDRFDWGDLAADAFGAALGAWLGRLATR